MMCLCRVHTPFTPSCITSTRIASGAVLWKRPKSIRGPAPVIIFSTCRDSSRLRIFEWCNEDSGQGEDDLPRRESIMWRYLIVILSIAFVGLPSYSQPALMIDWLHFYGDSCPDSDWDQVMSNSAVQTNDGGYLLAGFTHRLTGVFDRPWLVRTDSQGNLLWECSYGRYSDYGYGAVQTADGGFVTAGSGIDNIDSTAGEMMLLKVSGAGDSLWQRYYPDSADWAEGLTATRDGGFLLAGRMGWNQPGVGSCSDFYALKTDAAGIPQWRRHYDLQDHDRAKQVIESLDGGFLIVGESEPRTISKPDLALVRISSTGDTLWQRLFMQAAGQYPRAVVQLADSSILIAGGINEWSEPPFDSDAFLLPSQPQRPDDLATLLWSSGFGKRPAPRWQFCRTAIWLPGWPPPTKSLIASWSPYFGPIWKETCCGTAHGGSGMWLRPGPCGRCRTAASSSPVRRAVSRRIPCGRRTGS